MTSTSSFCNKYPYVDELKLKKVDINITTLKVAKNNLFGSEILISGDNSDNEEIDCMDSESDSDNDFFQKTQELSRHFKLDAKHKMRKCVVPYNESKPLNTYKP